MSRSNINLVVGTLALLLASAAVLAQTPLGSAFNYQGKLDLLGSPLNGTADFEITLWDADIDGNMIDAVWPVNNVTVVDGLFTVEIDFGVIAFNGDNRWLEIDVRSPAGDGVFTTLSPRQPLTVAPYALQTRGIFVDDLGNVGIGADTPQFPLQVHHGAGTGTVPANATAIYGSSASGYGLVGFSKGAARAGVWGENNATSGEARGVWGRSTFSTGIGVYAEGFSFSGANHALHAKTNSPNGYAGYFEGGRNYFEGNVGIGTTTPSEALEVAGTVTATAFVGDGSGLTGLNVDDADADPANELQTLAEVLAEDNDAGGADMLNLGTVDAAAFSSTSPLQLQTGGTTRIYVDDVTGDVGIGTTSPEADLHIRGDGALGSILVTPSLSQSNSQIFLTEQQSTSFGMIMRYDGAANQLHFIAQQSGVETDPLFSINRSSAGNVGIGTTAPGFKLEVNGSAGKPGGGSWSNASDRRLKKNINDLDGALDDLLALRGVTFEYKDPDAINELHGTRIGMIAQEVEEVFPDWVSNAGHGYKTVTFRGFEALTVEALRELRDDKDAQIASLEDEIAELREEKDSEIQVLADRLAKLESITETLAAKKGELR